MTNRNDTRTNPDQPANSGSSFTVQIVRSINEIEPALWDAINAPHGLYWTHRFFKSIESSGVMDASYWYIMFYQDGNLVRVNQVKSFREDKGFSEDLFDIDHLRAVYPLIPEQPLVPGEPEEPSEVQKTIEEFKRVFE